jgi:hypothetical protein
MIPANLLILIKTRIELVNPQILKPIPNGIALRSKIVYSIPNAAPGGIWL